MFICAWESISWHIYVPFPSKNVRLGISSKLGQAHTIACRNYLKVLACGSSYLFHEKIKFYLMYISPKIVHISFKRHCMVNMYGKNTVLEHKWSILKLVTWCVSKKEKRQFSSCPQEYNKNFNTVSLSFWKQNKITQSPTFSGTWSVRYSLDDKLILDLKSSCIFPQDSIYKTVSQDNIF